MNLSKIFKQFRFIKKINHITNDNYPEWAMHIFILKQVAHIASKYEFSVIPKEIDTIVIEDIFNYIGHFKWLPRNIQAIYFATDIKWTDLKTVPKHVTNIQFNYAFQHIEELTDSKLYKNHMISIYEANRAALVSKNFKTDIKNNGLQIQKINKFKMYFYNFSQDKVEAQNIYELVLNKPI